MTIQIHLKNKGNIFFKIINVFIILETCRDYIKMYARTIFGEKIKPIFNGEIIIDIYTDREMKITRSFIFNNCS